MRLRMIALAAGLLVFTCAGTSAAELTLGDKGKSDYQIVLPDTFPTPAIGEGMKQAARLVRTAFKANGVNVAVVAEGKRDRAKPGIYLGDTAFARTHGVDVSKLEGWGYVHKAVGRDLIVAGREQRGPTKRLRRRRPTFDRLGTVKGVADFLREYAGVRFLYPDLPPRASVSRASSVDLMQTPAIEYLPTPRIVVPADLNVRRTPPVRYNIGHGSGAGFYDLANNRFPRVDDVFGGHTWARAVPLKTYRKTHPEYFALVGGKRLLTGHGQYCISNPGFQELVYKDLIGWLDAGYATVDLGQPDGFRRCQCEDCKKLYGTGEDWNEKIWIFHRKLAERVLAARPGKQVTIMSYIQTALPPKTFKVFPENVRIMLTGTNERDIAPWRGYVVPGGFTGYIYNWCPNLCTRYTPMRTPRYVETQVKRLVRNRVQSLYRDGPGQLFGLEGPVYYIMGRMFDDAERLRAKDLMHEFCGPAFGKAAPHMLAFYDRLYQGIELYAEYLGTRCPAWSYHDIYGRRHKYLRDPLQLLGFLYTPRLMKTLEQRLVWAERKADTDKVRTRLALVRREFDYLKDLATVVHLYQAYEIRPDIPSRNRLLDAIDARNARITGYYPPRRRRRRARPPGGWAYTFFPMPGHDAKHLRLAYNRYQEPMADTCLNWDTKAMRKAPLPGAQRMAVTRAKGPISINAPQWKGVAAQPLRGLPRTHAPRRKTTVRALYDTGNVYFRIESEAPAAAMKSTDEREAVVVYLMPPAGREVIYRFTVGPRPDAKREAANGFVTDVMDPRHDQFDPDWKGEWTYDMRVTPRRNRWVALVKIPFKTLRVDAPEEGTSWRANIGRVHVADPKRVERSLWSATTATRAMDDRGAFGELVFQSASGLRAEKHPLQKWREKYNKGTSGVPAAWERLPDRLPKPFGPWTFRADPLERGVKERWYGTEVNASDWAPVKVPAFWAETKAVGNYQGYAWYRTTFTVPASWKGRAVRILFAGVDEQAWVYVNGRLVKEHSVKSEGKGINDLWEEPFAAAAPPDCLAYGKPNVLAVRVQNARANGGIWRPVVLHAPPVK